MLHKCPRCGMDMQQYNFIVRCNKCMEFYLQATGKHTGKPGLYKLKTEFVEPNKKEESKKVEPPKEIETPEVPDKTNDDLF